MATTQRKKTGLIVHGLLYSNCTLTIRLNSDQNVYFYPRHITLHENRNYMQPYYVAMDQLLLWLLKLYCIYCSYIVYSNMLRKEYHKKYVLIFCTSLFVTLNSKKNAARYSRKQINSKQPCIIFESCGLNVDPENGVLKYYSVSPSECLNSTSD
jgi:hypothetical protein